MSIRDCKTLEEIVKHPVFSKIYISTITIYFREGENEDCGVYLSNEDYRHIIDILREEFGNLYNNFVFSMYFSDLGKVLLNKDAGYDYAIVSGIKVHFNDKDTITWLDFFRVLSKTYPYNIDYEDIDEVMEQEEYEDIFRYRFLEGISKDNWNQFSLLTGS